MTTYPESREALFALIDGTEHAERTVRSYYQLPDPLESNLPAALIFVQRGTEGHVDRTDWVAVNVYAAPGEAIPILESIRASLVDRPHEVPGVGFIDDIQVEQTPQDVPYYSALIMQANALLRVTSRPL